METFGILLWIYSVDTLTYIKWNYILILLLKVTKTAKYFLKELNEKSQFSGSFYMMKTSLPKFRTDVMSWFLSLNSANGIY